MRDRAGKPIFEMLEGRRMMSAGTLDPTFGAGGKTLSGFIPFDVAVQADGKSLAVGGIAGDFAVMRLDASGKPDPSFGTNGLVKTDFGGANQDVAHKVAIQPDGKILVAGLQINGSVSSSYTNARFALARYNTNGSLDGTFGVGGKQIVHGGQTAKHVTGLGLQPGSNKIIFSASVKRGGDYDFIVTRLRTNGTLDNSFGDTNGSTFKGYTVTGFGGSDFAEAQLIQPDGKIIVGGTNIEGTSQMILARYTAAGSLDRTFSGDGKAKTTMVRSSELHAMTLQDDGKIVAAGLMRNPGGQGTQGLLRRFNTDGSYDQTLGNGTILLKPFGDSYSTVATSVHFRGSRILVVGMDQNAPASGAQRRIFTTQYLPQGVLDTFTFAPGGVGRLSVGDVSWPKAALAPDGKAVFKFSGFSNTSGVARFTTVVPVVTLSSGLVTGVEGTQHGSFRIIRAGAFDFPTRVYFDLAGTATHGQDYTGGFTVVRQVGGIGGLPTIGGTKIGKAGFATTSTRAYADIPAGKSEITVPVNIIDDAQLEPVEQADFILADNPLYTPSVQGKSTLVRIYDNDTVRINFQAPGLAPTGGYLPDTGQTFGQRTGGLSFGWDADNTANARQQNEAGSPDFRYDSYNHMQKNGANRSWEIAVPNGMYRVRLVAGDPRHIDSVFRMDLEGTPALAGTPASPTADVRWFRSTVNVLVSDGRLTLSNGAGAQNNKIAFIDIQSAPFGASAGPVTGSLPVRLVGPATMSMWTPKGGGIFSDNQIDEPLWA